MIVRARAAIFYMGCDLTTVSLLDLYIYIYTIKDHKKRKKKNRDDHVTRFIVCVGTDPDEWNMGARAAIYEKFKKMLFKSFKKCEVNFCVYILC
jgi:hypothetical protein